MSPRSPRRPHLALGLLAGLGGLGLSLALGPACKVVKTTTIYDTGSADGVGDVDRDGDGFPAVEDCDDEDADTYPGAPERCDGRNNDCDAGVDEDPIDGRSFHQDSDLDGYGNPDVLVTACERSPGFVEEGTDCDDTDAAAHPGATEVCNDGLDNDCDGDLAECDRTGNLSLADADAVLRGPTPGDQAGAAVALVGDMDGDGVGELAVGGPRSDLRAADAGAVWLWTAPLSGEAVLSDAGLAVGGPTAGSLAAAELAAIGDVNGDGYADLLVGAPQGDSGGIDSGGAYLLLGPPTGLAVLSDAAARFIGGYAYDEAGTGLSAGGDLTGDGVTDLLIGAVGYGDGGYQQQGSLCVVSSADSGEVNLRGAAATLTGTSRYDRLGAAAAVVADFNGDGVDDLAVGAPTWNANEGTGRVYLVPGPLSGRTGIDEAAAAWWDGEALGHTAGAALAAGDLDGDGAADLAVGAPGFDVDGAAQGAVYLLLAPGADGGGLLADAAGKVLGAAAGDELGAALDAAGDSNGDGRIEVWAGAPGQDRAATDAGAAGLLSGPPAGAVTWDSLPFKVFGVSASERAGASLSARGDHNGDGLSDLLIGAPGMASAGLDAGGAYLVLSVGL